MSDYDVIVIGSGFGGAVAARTLAEGGARVLVLERGRAFPPGSHPKTPNGVRRDFWAPQDGVHGKWDLWSFSGLAAITASGLGGGSLIYANVMLRKPAATFACDDGDALRPPERWPFTRDDLEPHYDVVEAWQAPQRYPYADTTPKAAALAEAAAARGWEHEHPPLAVTFGARPGEPLEPDPMYGGPRRTCTLCAACSTGCNEGAKHTLDLTVLAAAVRAGAEVRVCTEARRLEPLPSGWRVHYDQHVAAREGQPGHLLDPSAEPRGSVSAERVVVAAGAIGSTRLLLRNRPDLPRLSRRLGHGFTGNGDLITWARRVRGPDGALRYLEPSRGTTITTSVRPPGDHEHYVQDGGAPVGADWLWHAFDVPRALWGMRSTAARRVRDRLRGERDARVSGALAQSFGDARSSAAMLPMLGLGRDRATGRMTLRGDTLALDWRARDSAEHFEALDASFDALARAVGGAVPGGLFQRMRRYLTVHPLGGCAAAERAEDGVVGPYGEVFGHPGLHVLDGAAMPGPVGPNPSFTIAAFAHRGAEEMLR